MDLGPTGWARGWDGQLEATGTLPATRDLFILDVADSRSLLWVGLVEEKV